MREPLNPSLYQINTRVWLTELSRNLRQPAKLDEIPDASRVLPPLGPVTPKGRRSALAAYSIREQEGRPEGRNVEHWLQAEVQIHATRDIESCQG